jgi:hypothetical protein
VSGRVGGFSVTISAVDAASKTIDGVNKKIQSMSAPAEKLSKSLGKFGDVTGINRLAEGFGNLARSGQETFRALERVAPSLTAITGAATVGGVIALTQRFAQLGTTVQNTAYRLNTPVDKLSAMEFAARKAGSSATSLDTGMRTLQDTLSAAAWGRDAGAMQTLRSLNIDPGTPGHVKDTATAFGELADHIAAMKDPHQQVRALQVLGLPEDLLPLMRQGSAGIKKLTEDAQKFGGVIDKDMAKRADEMRQSFVDLETAVGGIATAIADKLAPMATKIAEKMAAWAAANREVVASGLLEWVGKVGDWVDRHPQVVKFLLGYWAGSKVAGPIGGLIGGVGASFPDTVTLPGDVVHSGPDDYSWMMPGGGAYPQRAPAARAAPIQHTTQEQDESAASVRDRLARDLNLTRDQSSGIVSNLLAEGGTMEGINERNPAPGTRGGFGWAQWTGSRRIAFEQWAAAHHRDIADPQTNYDYLVEDIRAHPDTLNAVRSARDPTSAAAAFFPFESGNDPGLQSQLPGHVANAGRVAGLQSGHVQVDVHLHGAPAGTTAAVTTTGPVSAAPPRIETPMPSVH